VLDVGAFAFQTFAKPTFVAVGKQRAGRELNKFRKAKDFHLR
jgi:hypothetical protein